MPPITLSIKTPYLLYALLVLPSLNTWAEADHNFDIGARARYSTVDESDREGRAASLLLRFSWQADWLDSLSSTLEYDLVETWLQDKHSDGLRFNGEPRIPDAPGDEINQAFLRWLMEQWEFSVGRQRIELANQRFIGSVAFWQNDQSYDALRVQYNFLSMSTGQYIYIDNTNRFWGEDAGSRLENGDIRPAELLGDHAHNTHLAHLEFKEWDYSELLAWYYSMENETANAQSNDTLGLGYRFNYKMDNYKYKFEADIARQKRQSGGQNHSNPYYRIAAGIGRGSAEISFNQEMLDSNQDGIAFITPLGSINDFQGWADVFFLTPPTGMLDTHLKIDWRFNPFRLDLRFHDYRATVNNQKYGTAVDVDFIWKPKKAHLALLRISDFQSKGDAFENESGASVSWTYNL